MVIAERLVAHAAWVAAGRPVDDSRQLIVHDDALRRADLFGASLIGANLRGADLGGANLGFAALTGANLRGASGITSAGPVGLERRFVYAVDHGDRIMVQAGCRWDTADAVIAAIETDYAPHVAMRDAYVGAVRMMVATLGAARRLCSIDCAQGGTMRRLTHKQPDRYVDWRKESDDVGVE